MVIIIIIIIIIIIEAKNIEKRRYRKQEATVNSH